MSTKTETLGPYTIYGEHEEESQFLRNAFPFQVIVVRWLVKRLLPRHLHLFFREWQTQYLEHRLLRLLAQDLERPVKIYRGQVSHYAPKYTEFRVTFFGHPEEDAYVKNVCGYGQSVLSSVDAKDKALGEFLERYFLAEDWSGHIKYIKGAQYVRGNVADITGMPCYTSWQQEEVRTTFLTREDIREAPIAWVKGRSLLRHRSVQVPAQRVFWMRRKEQQEFTINHPSTNGNGAGFSATQATLSALYEAVERDSFMCHWLMKLQPAVFDVTSITSPAYTQVEQTFERYGLAVAYHDISITEIPTVLCVITDMNDVDNPKMSIGAASGFSVEKLFDKSLMEALVVQRYYGHFDTELDLTHLDAVREQSDLFRDHTFDRENLGLRINLWQGKKMKNVLSFLSDGDRITVPEFKQRYSCDEVSTHAGELRRCKRIFRQLVKEHGEGYHPTVYRVNNKTLDRLGYHVCSVVVPNLFPLYMEEHMATLDISGLTHWRSALERRGRSWTGEIRNHYPHPFP